MTVDPFGASRATVLDPEMVRREVRRFLDEDVGTGDVTTGRTVPAGATARGAIVARQDCVVAGVDIARTVFALLDPSLQANPQVDDGAAVAVGTSLMTLAGRAAPILTGERLALNLLQRLSGVATVTRRYVDAVAGTGASVSDTRKTTPGLRLFEKYAVAVGGGRNHRIGLYDAILIKDNHIIAAGGLSQAVEAARAGSGPAVPIEVEIELPGQLEIALATGVDAVLLDNMTPEQVSASVRTIRAHQAGSRVWIEASGGITLQNIRAYAEAGVDTVSVGALTHSAPSVDIALDLEQSARLR